MSCKVLLIALPPMRPGAWVNNSETLEEFQRLADGYEALAQRLGISLAPKGKKEPLVQRVAIKRLTEKSPYAKLEEVCQPTSEKHRGNCHERHQSFITLEMEMQISYSVCTKVSKDGDI